MENQEKGINFGAVLLLFTVSTGNVGALFYKKDTEKRN